MCTVSLLYCSLCHCGVYRFKIVLQSLSVRCVQGHNCFEFCVSVICTRTLSYCIRYQFRIRRVTVLQSISAVCAGALECCSLCQFFMYKHIIVLLSVLVRYVQAYYFAAVYVSAEYIWSLPYSALFTEALFYCSLCQCGIYIVII